MAGSGASFECLGWEVKDGNIGVLTLRRPKQFNAMNVQLLAELNEVLEAVTNRDDGFKIRALLLTGEGRGFCAGADLAERKREQSPEYLSTGEGMAFNMTFRYDPLMKKLKNLPVPTISAINGVAAGGGLGLALTTDIAVAADTAKFVCVFVPR